MRLKLIFIVMLCSIALNTFAETKNDGNKYLFRPSERIEIGFKFNEKTFEVYPLNLNKTNKTIEKEKNVEKPKKVIKFVGLGDAILKLTMTIFGIFAVYMIVFVLMFISILVFWIKCYFFKKR